jgi:hypothetical protein
MRYHIGYTGMLEGGRCPNRVIRVACDPSSFILQLRTCGARIGEFVSLQPRTFRHWLDK